MSTSGGPDYEVYTIVRADVDGQRDYWQRLGAGWQNQDGSINVRLNGLPVNGRLHIREPRGDEAEQEGPPRD